MIDRVLLVAVLLTLTVLAGGLWRRLDGRGRAARAGEMLADDLGAPLGRSATLLQFSSPTCGPCHSTRRLLADLADVGRGVAHLEVDATVRVDLARRYGVLRTPTVLVADGTGRVVRRFSGAPRPDDVRSALAAVLGDADRIDADRIDADRIAR